MLAAGQMTKWKYSEQSKTLGITLRPNVPKAA